MKSSEPATAAPVRIGILQTDEVLAELAREFGDYPWMFERLLRNGAGNRPDPVPIEITSFDVTRGEYPAPADCHGYVITGSQKSVYDDEPWIGELAGYLERVLDEGRRIVGICFGHQLIAHFFGGETRAASVGWGVGVRECEVTGSEPWMDDGQAGPLSLIYSHKDQVTTLPLGARVIARSDFCPVSGFVMGEQVMTLQGHPEFVKGYSRATMTMRRELLGEATFQAGINSLARPLDNDRVGRWIVNFIAGERSPGSAETADADR